MSDSLEKIMNMHRKKTKRTLLAEAVARDYKENFKREYEAKMEKKVAELTYEQKKQFIASMKTGKNVGESMKEAGITDLEAAWTLLGKQLKTYGEYLADIEEPNGKVK